MKTFRRLLAAILFSALLLVVSIADLHAQVGFKFGPVVGENFANSQTLPSPFAGSSGSGASGYVLGLRTEVNLLGPLSLQTELLITERSFADDYTIPSGSPYGGTPGQTLSWAEKLQYLQIPILLKITPLSGFIQPYIFAGPNVGFKLSSSVDSAAITHPADQNAALRTLDLGLDVGGGVQLQLLPFLWIFGDVRYTYGLVDAYTSAQQSNLGNLTARDIKWMTGFMVGF